MPITKERAIEACYDNNVVHDDEEMEEGYLYLYVEGSSTTPFKLLDYDAQRGGYLDKESTLAKLKVTALKIWEPGLQALVPVELGKDGQRFKGNTRKTALRVTGPAAPMQPGFTSREDIFKILREMGATPNDAMAVLKMMGLTNAPGKVSISRDILSGLLHEERSRGLILDGDIMAQGQAISSLHVGFWQGRVVCVKAYSHRAQNVAAAKAAAQREADVSRDVHADLVWPSLIQVEQLIETNNHSVLVLPLLGKDASQLPKFGSNYNLDIYLGTICISILSAIARLSQLSLCHADIKPSNIMLPSHKGAYPTLIDLASCMSYGAPLSEFTASYGMDVPPQASLKWDLACLATTLYECAGSDLKLCATCQELKEALGSHYGDEALYRQLCRTLVSNLDVTVEQLQPRVWQPCLDAVANRLGADVAGMLACTWPTREAALAL